MNISIQTEVTDRQCIWQKNLELILNNIGDFSITSEMNTNEVINEYKSYLVISFDAHTVVGKRETDEENTYKVNELEPKYQQ